MANIVSIERVYSRQKNSRQPRNTGGNICSICSDGGHFICCDQDLISLFSDQPYDDVVELFNLIVTDDGFKMAVADTGVIGEEDIGASSADRKGTTEKLSITFCIRCYNRYHMNPLGSGSTHRSVDFLIRPLMRRSIEDQKRDVGVVVVPALIVDDDISESLGNRFGSIVRLITIQGRYKSTPPAGCRLRYKYKLQFRGATRAPQRI